MRHLSVWTKVSLWCWFAIYWIAQIAGDSLIDIGRRAEDDGNLYASGYLLGLMIAGLLWAVILTLPVIGLRWLVTRLRRPPTVVYLHESCRAEKV